MRFQLSIFIDPLALGGHAVYQLRNTITLSACAVATAVLVSACGGGSASTASLMAQATLTAVAASTSLTTGGTTTLSTSGGSGTGAVTYAVASGASSCSIASTTLTASAAGSCTVTATKAADATYSAATSAAITVTVSAPLVASTTYATFDETPAPTLTGFGDLVGSVAADPTLSSNKVAKLVKVASGATWAGATITTCATGTTGSVPTIPLSNTNKTMTLRAYAPVANTVFRLKVEDASDATKSVETEATVAAANTWETLTFNFGTPATGTAALNTAYTFNKVSIFPNFNNKVDASYYVDDLKFVGVSGVSQICPAAPVAGVPTTAATTPTVASTKALSVYSDAYTAITGVNLNPNWGQSTAQTQIQVGSNNVLKHASFNYQGFDWTNNAINVSTYTNLHIDLWSADATSVKVFVISLGQDTQSFTVPITASTWVSQDIALSTFSLTNKAAVIQVKLESVPFGGTTVYMDNLYFWKP